VRSQAPLAGPPGELHPSAPRCCRDSARLGDRGNSTHQRPSGHSSRPAAAAASAKRVLPMPPAPTMVTTACSRISASTASKSCARPKSGGETGRLPRTGGGDSAKPRPFTASTGSAKR
jgi:hypothetical protein